MLSRAVGVDGQGHVEEHRLQQTRIERGVLAVAEHAFKHVVQVKTVATEVPLQLQADLLVNHADAQTAVDVGVIVGPAPQTLVILDLAELQTCGDLRRTK